MNKSDFTYTVDHDLEIVKIVDLNLGNMSVTNDAENVVSYCVQQEIDLHDNIRDYRFFYKDSAGIIDELVPSRWEDDQAINIRFKHHDLLRFESIDLKYLQNT